MTIKENAVVSIHYTLKDSEGVELDSSRGQEPLHYLHGAGNIIPGLESELTGRAKGDAFQVSIEPERAYGEYRDALVQEVPREAFGEVADLRPGMRFQAQTPSGAVPVVVTRVEAERVTVDGNHPLAGKTLHFDVVIEEVREATQEELDHGHAHGPGGHSH